MKKYFLIFIACIVTYCLQAQVVWGGSSNGDWSVGSNWVGGSVPAVGADVDISTGYPKLVAAVTVGKLHVHTNGIGLNLNGQTLTVNGQFNVYNNTTINGGSTSLLVVNNSGVFAQVQQTSTINVPLSITTNGGLFLKSSTFNYPLTLTLTGSNSQVGGNTYNSTVSLNVSGGDLSVANNTGNDNFYDDITVSCTSSSASIHIGSTSYQAILQTGVTITAGSYSSGNLYLYNVQQTDASASQSVILGSSALLYIDKVSEFQASLEVDAKSINMANSKFHGDVIVKSRGNSTMDGNNIFYADIDLRLHATATNSYLKMYAGGVAGDTYHGDIILNNAGSGTIYFGWTNGITGNLLSTGDIVIGSTLGFASGTLQFKEFHQNGNTTTPINPQTISLTSAATFRTFTAVTFDDEVTITAPITVIEGTTFENKAVINNGIPSGGTTATSTWYGNNLYKKVAEITNYSSGLLKLATNVASTDEYKGNVTFKKAGSGNVSLGSNSSIAKFYADVTFDNITTAQLDGSQTGKFEGPANQGIYAAGGADVIFGNLQFNKTQGDVTLNTKVSISGTCIFSPPSSNYCRIITSIVGSTDNSLYFFDGATVSGAADHYYVDGPVTKKGNDPFTFPGGRGNYYRPLEITAPTSTATVFVCEYIQGDATTSPYGPNKDITIDDVSTCEYWTLTRAGSSGSTNDVYVKLSWNTGTSCNIANQANMRVAGWNDGSSIWNDHGNGSNTTTTVTSGTKPTNYYAFTLASTVCTATTPVISSDSLGAFTACLDIDPNGITLSSTSASYYQWYKDNIIMPAETLQTLTVIVSGTYKVVIHDANGCIADASVDVLIVPSCCVPEGTIGTSYDDNGSSPSTNDATDWGTDITGPLTYDGLIRNELGQTDCIQTFAINGTFNIDQNFTFRDVCVILSTGSQIVVGSGNTLTLDNAHLYTCDGGMWQGIDLTAAGSNLVVQNNTLIEDAQFAVNVEGGTYFIDHGNFNKNFISIFSVDNTNAMGDIRATRFLCYQTNSLNTGTWVDTDLAAPFTGEHSLLGILSWGQSMVPTMNVGGLATSQGCLFSNLYNGVFGYQSNVTAQYNTFEDLRTAPWAGGTPPAWATTYTPPFLPMANGIFMDSEDPLLPIALNIPYMNKFNNCYAGINVARFADANIANCKFNENVYGIAIRQTSQTGHISDIHGNDFRGNNIGIWTENINGLTADIYSNYILGTGANSPMNDITGTTLGWGIVNVNADPAESDTRIDIHNNIIEDVQLGIRAENWDNGLNRIESNTITVDESNILIGIPDIGIGIIGSALSGAPHIAENTVTGPLEYDGNLTGIFTGFSDAILQCNTIGGFDNGIETGPTTSTVEIRNNTIQDNTVGLFANGDGPSDIGTPTEASDNKWINNGTDVYSDGFNASSFTVYTRSNVAPYAAVISSYNPTVEDYQYDFTALISPLFSCGVVKSFSQSDTILALQIRALSNRMAMGEIDGLQFKAEEFWNIQYAAYSRLFGNEAAYNKADSLLLANYAVAQTGTIGKLHSALAFLGSTGNDSLVAQEQYITIAAISPVNNSETTLQSYALLQLNKVAHPRYKLATFTGITPTYAVDLSYTQSEESVLDSLARLCPNSHGIGVYMARAALSYKHQTYTSPCEDVFVAPTGVAENKEVQISVFPNPSNGNVFVKLPTDAPNAKIQVVSVTGAVLQTVNGNSQITELNLQHLANGLYFITIYDASGKYMGTRKISLQH